MATIVGTRNPIFWKSLPGGLPAIIDTSKFSGNVFYVDSAAATASDSAGGGWSPDVPFATIDYAIGQCTANQGDVILVLPGHAETINTAGGIEADKAGISIIGLGLGEDRPTITIGSSLDTATVLVSAADVLLKNMIFVPGNDGVDILIDIDADGCVLEDCELRSDETNAYQADSYIDINGGGANAADRCIIRRCKISSITAGAAQAINIAAVEDALVIEDCWIDGDFSAAGILSASIFTNALIRGNIVSNRAAGVHAVEFTAACTGLFVDNRMYSSTLGTILDPGSLKCLGNLETDAVDQAGVDSPRTSAGGFPDNSITADSIAAGAIAADAFAAGAIDAAAIAAAAIDAATFAADALQSMQDEAEDALEGENLDHIAAVTTVAADMTAEVVDGSILSRVLSKTSDTSSYDPTTDALEMASDKLGAFSGDGGAAQDDSIKASLDLAHTDIDAILADTGTDGVQIGADAITNAKIADDAFAAEQFAADCITNAKIADNAFAAEQFALSAGEKTTDGIVVTRATAALPQGTSAAIFTVTGLVLLKRIIGYVTVQIGAAANATKLKVNSTGAGATTDICATLDINGHVIDSRYEIDAVAGFAGPMIRTIDLPLVRQQTVDLVIPPGTIDLDCAGSDGGTGRIRWSVTYVPLESGAQIVAA